MKKLHVRWLLAAAVLAFGLADRAQAVPVPCIVCGSTPIVTGGGAVGTLSFAVISGVDFLPQGFPFLGAVPPGTLDALGAGVLATDFVYMYQLVNTGPALISSYEITLGGAAATLTAGGRLESTIFIDPVGGLVSAGPTGMTLGLSGLSPIDWSTFAPGPCLGSAPDRQCSDGSTDLLANSVEMFGFGEAPSAPLLDPTWTSSVMWFASALAPTFQPATVFDTVGFSGVGSVASIPEPSTGLLLGLGLAGIASVRRRRPQ